MSGAVFEGAIAIDFGTTYSRVAVWEGSDVTVIPDKYGNRKIPSCVTFADNGDILVGQDAANSAVTNPQKILFALKKLLLVEFDYDCADEIKERYPFSLAEGENCTMVIEIRSRGKVKDWMIEELTAPLLSELKKMAEAHLGKKVTKAVITVPTRFGENQQRDGIRAAAEIAGLEVLRFIDETMAAVITYRMGNVFGEGETRNVVFVEWGGFYFHIACVKVGKRTANIEPTGFSRFGGEDITHRLVEHCANEFERNNDEVHALRNSRFKQRLRTACERAKCLLSSQTETTIELDNLMEGIPFKTTISRDQFEEVCKYLFDGMKSQMEQIKEHIDKTNNAVHEVVLLGGSTRIPKVRQLLSDTFGQNVKLITDPNSDEAYVRGAAVQAFILSGGKSAQTDGLANFA